MIMEARCHTGLSISQPLSMPKVFSRVRSWGWAYGQAVPALPWTKPVPSLLSSWLHNEYDLVIRK